MELLYNGLTYCKDIVCLTNVPNLITYTGSSTVNIKAKYNIIINSLASVDPSETYTIYFGDYKITSVSEIYQATGTNFWLPPVNSYDNQLACCNSIVKALRNVPFIAANYNVWLSDNEDGTMANDVYIEAKKPGAQWNYTIGSDIPTTGGNSFTRVTAGSSNDELTGSDNRITVDVYKYTTPTRIGGTPLPTDREFVTSLEKSYSGKPVTFNVSPILSTLVNEGEMRQYCFTIYAFSDGQLKFSHMTEDAYITPGYQVNQSEPFIGTFTNRFFAANVSRGDEREVYNKTLLYAYEPNIAFSLYVMESVQTTTVSIGYMDSALNVLHTQTEVLPVTDVTNSLNHYSVQLNDTWFREATYIDVSIPDVGTVRYNVIKPINATDSKEAERILWHNEYGGISFMDFVGSRTEVRKEEIEYYQKQNFDFYTADGRENTKVYKKAVPVSVTHKTHNISGDGKYLLFSLQNSSVAWTYRNGVKYYIHIDNFEIKESSNASHIYVATVSYTFSYPDLI